MDLLTPSPSGSGLILAPSAGLTDRLILEIMADRLFEKKTQPSDQILALVAKELIRLGVTGKGSSEMAYAIGGVVARLSRVKEDNPDEPIAGGDASLVHLYTRMSGTTNKALRSWRACDLGDRSLMFASRWAGRHLDTNMGPSERRQYCEGMACAAYEQAVDLARENPNNFSGWMNQTLPPLIGSVKVATSVLAGFHEQEVPQAQLF